VARLHHLISVGGERAGFLLPVFRVHEGSNQELVQQIDQFSNIVSFDPLWSDGPRIDPSGMSLEAEIGQPSVWAFRDQDEQLHIGTSKAIQAIGLSLLSKGALDSCPMAAADMASFCDAEAQFPDAMRSAFAALKQLSPVGAETWRDAVVLLPSIKRDIAQGSNTAKRLRMMLDDIVVITHEDTTHIYAPTQIAPHVGKLPRWRALAGIFGINNVEVHSFSLKTANVTPKSPSWSLLGVGGIARFIITQPPFYGSRKAIDTLGNGAIAQGITSSTSLESLRPSRLLVGVVGSDVEAAGHLAAESRALLSEDQFRHILNVRPIGFGTPSSRKASPKVLREVLSDFSCLWILANHRLRQTGSYSNSLSARNIAGRFVQAGAAGLIACLETQDGIAFLREASAESRFGLVGAARFNRSVSEDTMVRHVLYSMLCEDALLHSAKRIRLYWPQSGRPAQTKRKVKLGNHYYDVEMTTRSDNRKLSHVVGFATGVRLSLRAESDFRDLCVSIVAGYGWEVRQEDASCLTLENEGAWMRIWPVISPQQAMMLVQQRSEYGQEDDMIISNQSISKSLRAHARAQNWGIAHYSEIGRWMRSEYRMGVFRDL
jgi:hypothetical protein